MNQTSEIFSKSRWRKVALVFTAIVILTACTNSEKKDLEEKKEALAKYKADLKEVNGKIDELEKDIARMDTSFKIEQKPKPVEVEVLKKKDFKHYIEVEGTVDAAEDVTALNQVPGIVTAVFVKIGEHVTKGQILATTDNEGTYEDQLAAAETNLALADSAYNKQNTLWGQHIGSEIQYLQARTQKEAAAQQIDALKKQIEMTKVIAPIDGTVDAVNLRVGELAAPSALMPGIHIVNGQRLRVLAKLADTDYGKVKEGDVVQINFPDINKTIEAPVTYVSQTIDPRSRTFMVEVKLGNEHNEYAANMIAKLKINDKTFKDVIVVPSNIIQTSTENSYVLVAETDNGIKVARKKVVQPGVSYNGQTVITSGLNEGDKIITFGYTELIDGQKIDF